MTLEVQDQQDQAEVPDLGVIPVQKVILEVPVLEVIPVQKVIPEAVGQRGQRVLEVIPVQKVLPGVPDQQDQQDRADLEVTLAPQHLLVGVCIGQPV